MSFFLIEVGLLIALCVADVLGQPSAPPPEYHGGEWVDYR